VCGPDFALAVRLSPERFGMVLDEIRTVFEQLGGDGRVDLIDMSLWDCFKEPVDEAHQGRSLAEIVASWDRGAARLGVAGKIHDPADAQRVLDLGIDVAVLGRVAILHHDYPQRVQTDPGFVPRRAPVPRDVLLSEGVSPSFVDYLAGTFRFVAD
jgi:2,4-dienoyl-CoA reductase-like NADH-dependent reductase (Old Yellow Enzyme family)